MGWVRGAHPFHNWEKGNVKAEAGKGHWETLAASQFDLRKENFGKFIS